ncbi:hydrolase, NUDIX family [Gleimia coleocanis DSM 15436]|uniref:Hydrolase, NUDIX family n=1 Tax=Gleimia coleocanis DSM 15436 TaxID=525245 RepID=C0VZ88_9ACTO|nr:NUDIX hydrolase [Gleimia coleocanis]EEH64189.1 hydrolase, NUDIX family [Gleimia coleocanis DSM 15436]
MIADERKSYPVLEHQRVWHGAVFDMDEDLVQLAPDSDPVRRHYVAHTGAVAVVALRGEAGSEEIALVDQYRHPVQAKLWEIPAGLLDIAGEDPLLAAQRELWEEADLRADTWHVLVDYFTSPGGSTEELRIYLARDVVEVPEGERHVRCDEEQTMALRWVNLNEAIDAVHAGLIHNPSAVVGILAAGSARSRNWESLRSVESLWFKSPLGR